MKLRTLPVMTLLMTMWFFCHTELTWLLTTTDALHNVALTLSHDSANPSCEICGAVLEMLDDVHLSSLNPYFGVQISKNGAINTISTIRSCEIDPYQPMCDTFWERQRNEYKAVARSMIEQVNTRIAIAQEQAPEAIGNMANREAVSEFMAANEDMLIRYVMQKKRMIPTATVDRGTTPSQTTQSLFRGADKNGNPLHMDGSNSEACSECVVFSNPAMSSPASDPRMSEVFITNLWYLRYPLNPTHHQFCYETCEGTLSTQNRILVLVLRWYGAYNIAAKIRNAQVFLRGMMGLVSLVLPLCCVCFYRYTTPSPLRAAAAGAMISAMTSGSAGGFSKSNGVSVGGGIANNSNNNNNNKSRDRGAGARHKRR